jgi:hypothetical protein
MSLNVIEGARIFGEGFAACYAGTNPALVPYLSNADAQRTEVWLEGWQRARTLIVLARNPELHWRLAEEHAARDALDAVGAQ